MSVSIWGVICARILSTISSSQVGEMGEATLVAARAGGAVAPLAGLLGCRLSPTGGVRECGTGTPFWATAACDPAEKSASALESGTGAHSRIDAQPADFGSEYARFIFSLIFSRSGQPPNREG